MKFFCNNCGDLDNTSASSLAEIKEVHKLCPECLSRFNEKIKKRVFPTKYRKNSRAGNLGINHNYFGLQENCRDVEYQHSKGKR